MKLLTRLRQFQKSFSSYQPLIEVIVYKDHIIHNLHEFQSKYAGYKIAPVLKSNAYSHGLVEVAKILDKEDLAFLVVDSVFEATVLRKEGIKSKILVIGYTKFQDINRNRYKNTFFAITNLVQLAEISANLKTEQTFHLKIDTGMHRQGILLPEIKSAVEKIKKNKNIILEGICSHFADADSQDKNYSMLQIKNWNSAVKIFKKEFPRIKYFHIAATAGSGYIETSQELNNKLSSKNTNVIRLGLGLYGIDLYPFREIVLKPALELRTVISGIKTIQKGDYIGYGLTFKAKNKMKMATVPAGYFEGVDRRLSNCGYYKLGNSFCPIVGRVSMNISVMDVSKNLNAKVGSRVILISSQKENRNSVWNIAKLCNTNSHEILIHIPQHLRRVIS